MKKIYTMLFAASVAISATAAEAGAIRGDVVTPKRQQTPAGLSFSSSEFQKLPPQEGRTVRGLRKADASATLEGTWTFVCYDTYFSDSAMDGIALEYNASVNGSTVTFTPTSSDQYGMIAFYDEAQGVLVFSRDYLGKSGDRYVYQQPFIYNWKTNDLDYSDITAEICVTQNVIMFEADAGIYWAAYGDMEGTSPKGALNILDMLCALAPPEGEWKDLGNATFMDGWLIPAYGENQADYLYEVPLQQSVANPSIYRLVNPYKAGPLSNQNQSKGNGYIMFDVSDPDHVVFLLSDAGFVNSQAGVSMFFPYNHLGVLLLVNPGYTTAELVSAFGESIPYSTFKDGVVNLNKTDPEGRPDARFGLQYDPSYGMYWAIDNNGTPANMTAKIVFPEDNAVEIIGAEDTAAPAEYFNLQGVRVLNPQPGQIVICRQGSKTTKLIAR